MLLSLHTNHRCSRKYHYWFRQRWFSTSQISCSHWLDGWPNNDASCTAQQNRRLLYLITWWGVLVSHFLCAALKQDPIPQWLSLCDLLWTESEWFEQCKQPLCCVGSCTMAITPVCPWKGEMLETATIHKAYKRQDTWQTCILSQGVNTVTTQ